jgi:GNAT superfamily N-acetyltransferase
MKLRPYKPFDDAKLAAVWFAGWLSTGLARPVVTEADLHARVAEELAARWTVTVAEMDERIVGFLAVALEERRLDQLFVRPTEQGLGVGAALFDAALAQLGNGFWLTTQMENERARKFYERRGMRLDRLETYRGAERAIYVLDPSAS